MSETIYELSETTVDFDDIGGQAAFIETDLATGARIAVPSGSGEPDRLFVLTETTSYQMQRFTDVDNGTWQVGVVTSIRSRSSNPTMRDVELYTVNHPIEVLPSKEAAVRALARNDAMEWTLPVVDDAAIVEDLETKTLRQAILLTQAVEAILRTLEILPVKAISKRNERGRIVVQIVGRETSRDETALSVGGRRTVDVLEKLFDKDDQGIDVEWRLSTSGGLGGSTIADVHARFETVVKGERGEPIYEFSVLDLPDREDTLFLRKSGDHGTESLIKRRLRTSRVLAEQHDLVTMFADPRRNLRNTGDALEKDAFFYDLDCAKQAALEMLWTTAPTQLVVGPPGVGKTKLVSEVLRRKVATDPAVRILVSAQSHHALDHVLRSTVRLLDKAGTDAIVVRSPGPDGTVSTDADVRLRALHYLTNVFMSKLFHQAPAGLQSGINALRESFLREEGPKVNRTERRQSEGMRALIALVLESANLVFSTSTSADIEGLIDEGAQFDWVIIEEAAKAAGPDLIAPLALSGRRLFIGDHNQLPPFDSERMNDVLGDLAAIRNLLDGAERAIGSIFYESGLDDLRETVREDDALHLISAMAVRTFEPFRALVEEDERRRSTAGKSKRAVSSELLIQHRMDPQIAKLISMCFYQDRLTTGAEREAEAATPLSFSFGPEFPTSPLVFVDMPHVSRTGQARPAESDRPKWHNPSEVKIVATLLNRLTADRQSERKPSLAVLAPYRRQVERLAREVDVIKIRGGLTKFQSFNDDDGFCGTVDSSQGSEADLVVVSLVRNNARTGVPALGFLRDSRRMNVLLSRARQQLVVVGSLEFLRESSRHASASDDEELSFVVKFLAAIQTLTQVRCARGVAAATIVSAREITGPGT
jgi:AAA domain-containing protein